MSLRGSLRLEELMSLPAAATRPARRLVELQYDTAVPTTVSATFSFFADPGNLERLTPEWLRFRILTPRPIVMQRGTEIDYRITLYGFPIRWTSRIEVWEPGVRFVDRQLRGPYRWWRHEHRFEPVAGGTRVIDRIEYAPRAPWISGRLVRRDVERIFRYREGALKRLLTPGG